MLIAVAPQVGGPKLVAAAPELMVALGLTLRRWHVAPQRGDKDVQTTTPLMRAAVVGGGAYMAGKSRARNQAEQAQYQADQDARISDLEQQQAAQQPPQPQSQQPPPRRHRPRPHRHP